MESKGESIVGEDSICGIVNSFSKVIDEMNKSTTNHAARVDRNLRSNFDSAIDHVWNGAAPMPCVPGMVNVAGKFGVPLKTLEDIGKLTKGIELGKYEAVRSGMISEKRKAVMDAIFAMWDVFGAANPSGICALGSVNSGSLGSMAKDTPNLVDTMHIDESPIAHSVSIQENPSSYVGAAGGLKPEPSKSKASFRLLFSENLCEGVDFSIPRKIVETVSTRFVNTLYGYFLDKRIVFPVVEYYV
ncbi:hypothetical protein Tco_1109229 [Tanacetum coccineum]